MDQQEAINRLQQAMGLTDEEMELARSASPVNHWADMGGPLETEFAARVSCKLPNAAALVTELGHTQGWLPRHLTVGYDRADAAETTGERS